MRGEAGNKGFHDGRTGRIAGERGAVSRGTPGSNARRWMASRFVVSFAVPIAAWVGAYVLGRDMETIATYGVPLALLVTGAFFLSGDYKRLYWMTRDRVSSAKGASAEEDVASFLNDLPLNHFVIHSYDTGMGDVDHVLACSKGVFTMETKGYSGSVSADGDRLLRNNRPFDPDPIRQALSEASMVQGSLEAGGLSGVRTEPLIVFPKGRVRIRERVGGVAVVSLSYLPKYIEHLPDRITTATALRAYNILLRRHHYKPRQKTVQREAAVQPAGR